jgi:hypothetical protein
MIRITRYLLLPLAAFGCSSAESGQPTSSTVRGALVQSSFAAAPTGVEAIDDVGTTIRGTLAADGSFAIIVPKDHTYRLTVLHGSSSEPIVFPRISGALDTTFRTSGGGAVVTLGAVRHFNSAPAGGFMPASARPLSAAPPLGSAAAAAGECENGVVPDTGAVCIDDDAAASCEASDGAGESQDDSSDGECTKGVDEKTGAACTDPVEGEDKAAETESDGECEDGVDAKTGAACVDQDADPTQPMAIPEHNAPDVVAGCAEGEDAEDD